MCLVPAQIYERDNDWLARMKKKHELKSRAVVIKRIIKLIQKHKMEEEI